MWRDGRVDFTPGEVFIKAAGLCGGTAPLGLGHHPDHPRTARQGEGQNITGFDAMAGFFHPGMIEPHPARHDQGCCPAPVFHEAGVDEPLVEALAQFLSRLIWAFSASSTAKGDSGSAFRS